MWINNNAMKLLLLTSLVFVAHGSLLPTLKRAGSHCGPQTLFTENNGHLQSHDSYVSGANYYENMDCTWVIEAPAGLKVELVPVTFHLENDNDCAYDYIELFDGNGIGSPSMGKYCGGVFAPISSTGEYLTVRFVTDDSYHESGFDLFYNFTSTVIHQCHVSQFKCSNGDCIDASLHCDNSSDCSDKSDEKDCGGVSGGGCQAYEFTCTNKQCVSRDYLCDGDDDCTDNSDELPETCHMIAQNLRLCGEKTKAGASGTLTSQNYPNAYPNDVHCVYRIQAPPGTHNIHFSFASLFNVEPDNTCDYDWVKVTGDADKYNHGPFCGNSTPAAFSVPGDHAFVAFFTDDSDTFPGFSLSWNSN
ncbi:bone morphogenetic protein 1-like isoform X2 [Mya arenaria]|uniref:bone morphogenetic protein 1-like isoform X2 n=1 Tax=Mya arenaria TaxID=6604 RepID=UPI0022E65CD2|nr:bone morphogenetic protein 1-like isoform X2 [Mya arenaria]